MPPMLTRSPAPTSCVLSPLPVEKPPSKEKLPAEFISTRSAGTTLVSSTLSEASRADALMLATSRRTNRHVLIVYLPRLPTSLLGVIFPVKHCTATVRLVHPAHSA